MTVVLSVRGRNRRRACGGRGKYIGGIVAIKGGIPRRRMNEVSVAMRICTILESSYTGQSVIISTSQR